MMITQFLNLLNFHFFSDIEKRGHGRFFSQHEKVVFFVCERENGAVAGIRTSGSERCLFRFSAHIVDKAKNLTSFPVVNRFTA